MKFIIKLLIASCSFSPVLLKANHDERIMVVEEENQELSSSLDFCVNILQIHLSDINEAKNTKHALNLYPAIILAVQCALIEISLEQSTLNDNVVTFRPFSEKRKDKLIAMQDKISTEYNKMKENDYYGCERMKTLCNGTNDLLGIEVIIEFLSDLLANNDVFRKQAAESADK